MRESIRRRVDYLEKAVKEKGCANDPQALIEKYEPEVRTGYWFHWERVEAADYEGFLVGYPEPVRAYFWDLWRTVHLEEQREPYLESDLANLEERYRLDGVDSPTPEQLAALYLDHGWASEMPRFFERISAWGISQDEAESLFFACHAVKDKYLSHLLVPECADGPPDIDEKTVEGRLGAAMILELERGEEEDG